MNITVVFSRGGWVGEKNSGSLTHSRLPETLRARGSLASFARLHPAVLEGTATRGQPVGAV